MRRMRLKSQGGRRAGLKVAATLALAAWVAVPGSGHAASVLVSGSPFVLPEGIALAPDGSLLVSDAFGHAIVPVSTSGTVDAPSDPVGFDPLGEIALGSNYGSNAGKYLAYGESGDNINGELALVGSSGKGTPTSVTQVSGHPYTGAVIAPTNYGTGPNVIKAGDIVLVSKFHTGIEFVSPAGLFTPTLFASASAVDAFGIAFAPASFGTYGGDLFVSDATTGNVYVVLPDGSTVLFATLPLPTGFNAPGLRQITFAPSDFGVPCQLTAGAAPTTCYGDLFVSVSPQDNGGGNNGYIEALGPDGSLQAGYTYQLGDKGSPLAPRGLLFDGSTLYVSNADPGVNTLDPSDFVPAGEFLNVPEPAGWTLALTATLATIGLRRHRASKTTVT